MPISIVLLKVGIESWIWIYIATLSRSNRAK